MNPFFSILSLAYIAGIFLFADSPVVSDLAAFNPYSLLHIPLYGILTFLLILSFSPFKFRVINSGSPTNSTNLLLLGLIALGVAVADEIHQAYIPTRNASITDVLLDIIGILFFIFLFRRVQSIRWFLKKVEFLCQRTLKR
jgi:VanZ family protein